VRFGVHTGLQNTTTDELRSLWRHVEGAGFGWVSIWDHFYAADATITADGTTSGSVCHEAVASHTALAMETRRVRCGSLVYCVAYRHPAVLANAMSTIDHLSGGRVTLGLGAGWHQGEFAAYGIPFPAVPVRLRMLDEAIQCIRLLLTEEVADFDGEFFTLRDARCDPKPVQARLPLWVGGGGERVTLRITARHADGWNIPFVTPDVYRRKVSVLHEHCEREGRDPATIEKSVNLTLAWSEAELRARFGGMADWILPSALTGSSAEIVDRVAEFQAAGADWVNVAMRAPFDVESVDRFAAEVLPAFR
jgi:F420-dependent oxidoreductase-like protein